LATNQYLVETGCIICANGDPTDEETMNAVKLHLDAVVLTISREAAMKVKHFVPTVRCTRNFYTTVGIWAEYSTKYR
jgi:hypothetical protein